MQLPEAAFFLEKTGKEVAVTLTNSNVNGKNRTKAETGGKN